MRTPGQSSDEPPGGRALERLRQFEAERGLDESVVLPGDVDENRGEEERLGEDDEDGDERPDGTAS